MRQIGVLDNGEHARSFAAFLVTQNIDALVEEESGDWELWVRDENQLDRAKELLAEFKIHPHDEKYQNVESAADAVLRAKEKRRADARKNVVAMRGKWSTGAGGGLPRHKPITLSLIGVCVLVFMFQGFGFSQRNRTDDHVAERTLMFADPAHFEEPGWTASRMSDRMLDIRQGEVWRLVTPMLLHGDVLHILFNMYWLLVLGAQIENRYGASWTGALWYVAFVLVVSAASNLAEFGVVPAEFNGIPLGGGQPFGGGMSGVVYGVFGFVWIRSRYDRRSRLQISQTLIVLMLGWFVLCAIGVVESFTGSPVANWAHGIGLVTGMAFAFLPLAFQNTNNSNDSNHS